MVINYDPEGKAGHRAGEPSDSPLMRFTSIAGAAFVVGTVMRAVYLWSRLKRKAQRPSLGTLGDQRPAPE